MRVSEFQCTKDIALGVCVELDSVITRRDDVLEMWSLKTGELQRSFPKACKHFVLPWHVAVFPGSILEHCDQCLVIRRFNIHTGQSSVVSCGVFGAICAGPGQSILVENQCSTLQVLKSNRHKKRLQHVRNVTLSESPHRLHYMEQHDLHGGLQQSSGL